MSVYSGIRSRTGACIYFGDHTESTEILLFVPELYSRFTFRRVHSFNDQILTCTYYVVTSMGSQAKQSHNDLRQNYFVYVLDVRTSRNCRR